MQLFPTKESDVMKVIKEYLAYRNIYMWRNNSGSYETNGRYISYGKAGTADLLGVYPGGRFFAIEVKRPGGALSPAQIEFLREVRKRGGVALVAESVEDVDKCLKDSSYAGVPKFAKHLEM